MVDINKDVKIKIQGDTSDIENKLNKAGSSADQAGNKFKQAGEKGKQGFDKTSQSADLAKIKIGTMVTAVGQMTSSIAGMGTQILDFRSKVIALEKTMLGLESQQLSLKRMQEDLQDAVDKGEISFRDYQRAVEDINLAHKNMILEEKNVSAETNKLKGEYVTFGIQAVGTITQVALSMTLLGASKSFSAVAGGLKLISSGLWTIAKHPVFLIITAGILAWELGIKSIVEDLTGIADLGIFSNLEKAFNGVANVVPEASAATEDFGNQIQWTGEKAEGAGTALVTLGERAGFAGGSIKGLGSSFGQTSSAILEFNQLLQGSGVEDLENRVKALTLNLENLKLEGIDPLSPAFKQASAAIMPEIESIAQGLFDTFGKERMNEYLESMKTFGVGSVEELDKIADAVTKVDKSFTDLKKNFNNVGITGDTQKEILSEFDQILNGNKAIGQIRRLMEHAANEYQNGNLAGALFIEKQIQRIGRSQSTTSGKLRSIAQQMADNSAKRFKSVTARNGPGRLDPSVSASSLQRFGGTAKFFGTHGSITQQLSRFQLGGESRMSISRTSSGLTAAKKGRRGNKTTNIGDRIRALARQADSSQKSQALLALTGMGSVGFGGRGFRAPKIGNNAGLNQTEIDDLYLREFQKQRRQAAVDRGNALRNIIQREFGVNIYIPPTRLLKAYQSNGGIKEIKGVLAFQQRNGLFVSGATT